MRILEARHGWVVTYEDPRYVHESQLRDVTESVAKRPVARRILVPRGGAFQFEYALPEGVTTIETQRRVPEALIAAYDASGIAAEFEVLRANSVFHIVPIRTLSASGEMVKNGSILDARVSLPPKPGRSAYEALDETLAAVGAATGSRIGVGTIPYQPLLQTRYEGGAALQPARQLVMRLLRSIAHDMSWRLLYDPGQQMYALNASRASRP